MLAVSRLLLARFYLCRLNLYRQEIYMTTGFAGRGSELALLRKRLAMIAESGTGTALAIRGRRQVGKSRLAQEF